MAGPHSWLCRLGPREGHNGQCHLVNSDSKAFLLPGDSFQSTSLQKHSPKVSGDGASALVCMPPGEMSPESLESVRERTRDTRDRGWALRCSVAAAPGPGSVYNLETQLSAGDSRRWSERGQRSLCLGILAVPATGEEGE